MADRINKLTYVIEINDKGKVKIDNLTRGFVKADAAMSKLNTSLKKTTKDGLNPMIDKTGLAGATLVELGRTISDMPYGIRGIANNLSQLSTLFTTLIATTGGFKNGIAALKDAFRGPLGLIVVFQAVIAAIDYFAGSTKKAEEKVESFTGAIIKNRKELDNYLTVIDDIILSQEQLNLLLEGAAASDEKFFNQLNDLNLSQEERNKKIRDYLELNNEILSIEGEIRKIRDEIRDLGEVYTVEEIKELEGKIQKEEEASKLISGLSRTQADQRVFNLKKELEQEELNASEVTRLNLELAELFIRLAKLREKQGEGANKTIREQLNALNPFFEKFFFDIDKNGKISFKGILGDVEYVSRVLAENGAAASDELARMGERYDDWVKFSEDSAKSFISYIKKQTSEILSVFSATQKSLGYLSDVFDSYNEARMEALKRERDYALHSGKLTGDAQRKALADIEKRELKAQVRRIKQERDFFTIKQVLLIGEEIIRAKAYAAEQIRIAQLAVAKGKATAQQIALDSISSIGAANMSIGAFVKALGPYGIAAFGITIGGLIASILAARKKAQAAISGLGIPSVGGGGGGGGVEAPDFNVVGASPESQLAQSVSQQQEKPLRAFVVHQDIKNANELDRKITEPSRL